MGKRWHRIEPEKKGMAMNLAKLIPAILLSVVLASPLWGAPRYGDATIEQGSLTVVRGGKRLNFTQSQGRVPVEEQDLLRVGPSSRVLLNTPQKATLTLGSNAVMHVKPWEKRERRGFLSMLFGRVRSSVAQLTGGEQFSLKTATATIGVKGTEFDTTQDVNQNVWTFTREGLVEFFGLEGLAVDIPPGNISVIVNGGSASDPTTLPPLMQSLLESLDAVDPTSDAAGELPGGQELVDSGIVDQGQLDESKQEGGGTGDTGDTGSENVTGQSTDDAQQSSAAARAKLDIRFER